VLLWRYYRYSVWLRPNSKLQVYAVAAESDIRPLLTAGDAGVCSGGRCGTSVDKECLRLGWPSTANSFPFSASLFRHCAPPFSEPGCGVSCAVSPATYTEGPTRCETHETACDSLNVEAIASRADSLECSTCRSTNKSKLYKLTASAILSLSITSLVSAQIPLRSNQLQLRSTTATGPHRTFWSTNYFLCLSNLPEYEA
jgi:hypothetical protein